MNMKDFIVNVINTGTYVLDDMEERIDKMYVCGKLTVEERDYLQAYAAERVNDSLQIDVAAILADLEQRVSALESKGVKVWTAGMVTAKGQTVLYDVDRDGTLDYCRYDGGRATTSSSPGKIEGWVKTDSAGNVTHRIVKVDGEITLEPVEGE